MDLKIQYREIGELKDYALFNTTFDYYFSEMLCPLGHLGQVSFCLTSTCCVAFVFSQSDQVIIIMFKKFNSQDEVQADFGKSHKACHFLFSSA